MAVTHRARRRLNRADELVDLAVLRLLTVECLTIGQVADRFHTTHDDVLDLAYRHGYPSLDRLDAARQRLLKARQDAATTPAATAAPPEGPVPAPTPTRAPVTHEERLVQASKSGRAETRRLGEIISAQLIQLDNALAAEHAAHIAAARRAARENKRLVRVRELEAELASLGPATRAAPVKARLACDQCDRIFGTASGLGIHRARSHQPQIERTTS